jgi:hypothetical protein
VGLGSGTPRKPRYSGGLTVVSAVLLISGLTTGFLGDVQRRSAEAGWHLLILAGAIMVAAGLVCGVALIIVLVIARSRRRTEQSGAEADWGLDTASDWQGSRRSGWGRSPRDPEHSLPERELRAWEQPRRSPRRRPDQGQPEQGQPEWERPEQGRPERRRPEPAAANSPSTDTSSPEVPSVDVPPVEVPSLDVPPVEVPSLDATPLDYQPRREPVRSGPYPSGNGSRAARIAAERPSPEDRPAQQQDGARHAYLPRVQGAESPDPQQLPPPSPPQPEPVRLRSWFEPSLQPKPATVQPSDSRITSAPSSGPAPDRPPQASAQPPDRPPHPPAQAAERSVPLAASSRPPSPLESSRPDSGAQPPSETREHEPLDDTRPLPVILADRPAPRQSTR